MTASRRSGLWVSAGVAILVGLALWLGISNLTATPVALQTSDHLHGGCFLSNVTGELIADGAGGTAIVAEDAQGRTVPVIWPSAYSGRTTLLGGVDVIDGDGHVVATTGNRYELLGGYSGGGWLACVGGVFPPQ